MGASGKWVKALIGLNSKNELVSWLLFLATKQPFLFYCCCFGGNWARKKLLGGFRGGRRRSGGCGRVLLQGRTDLKTSTMAVWLPILSPQQWPQLSELHLRISNSSRKNGLPQESKLLSAPSWYVLRFEFGSKSTPKANSSCRTQFSLTLYALLWLCY